MSSSSSSSSNFGPSSLFPMPFSSSSYNGGTSQSTSSSIHSPLLRGVLKEHKVANARNTPKWLCVALIIGGVVGIGLVNIGIVGLYAHLGMLPTAYAALNCLGALGQAGSIAMIVGGGVLILGGVVGVLCLARKKTITSSKVSTIGSSEEPESPLLRKRK